LDDRLNALLQKCKEDEKLKDRFLESRNAAEPAVAFCATAASAGVEISVAELATLGERNAAEKLRSSQDNMGAGQPAGWGDEYGLFFLSLRNLK